VNNTAIRSFTKLCAPKHTSRPDYPKTFCLPSYKLMAEAAAEGGVKIPRRVSLTTISYSKWCATALKKRNTGPLKQHQLPQNSIYSLSIYYTLDISRKYNPVCPPGADIN
jgi:hypothetical protein